MVWDGIEKRDHANHDLLIEIHTDLKNFMKRFDEHIIEDTQTFEKMDKRLSILEKFYWMILGIIVIMELIFKFT